MIADPEGRSFIVRTVGHRRYSDGEFVTHDPKQKFISLTWRRGTDRAFMHSLLRALVTPIPQTRPTPIDSIDQTRYSPPPEPGVKPDRQVWLDSACRDLGDPLSTTGAHHFEIENRVPLLGARAFLHVALGVAAVSVAYFFAARVSLALLTPSNGVAVFWPAAGVASGLVIALGSASRWPVALGWFLATIVAHLMVAG